MASIKPASDLPTLLRQSHARIYRIALALSDNRSNAEAVVEKVLRRSGHISRQWETDEEAQRWFMHYTVLLCRAMNGNAIANSAGSESTPRAGSDRHKPGSWEYLRTGVHGKPGGVGDSALLGLVRDPESVAILGGIGQLPTQQREAFLLHHGEEMDLRQIATAMDCSSAAAANHLVAAVKSLKELQLTGIGEFTARLPAMLRQLLPPAEALDVHLQTTLATQRRRTRIWHLLDWSVQIILLIAVAWLIWWIWKRIEIV